MDVEGFLFFNDFFILKDDFRYYFRYAIKFFTDKLGIYMRINLIFFYFSTSVQLVCEFFEVNVLKEKG